DVRIGARHHLDVGRGLSALLHLDGRLAGLDAIGARDVGRRGEDDGEKEAHALILTPILMPFSFWCSSSCSMWSSCWCPFSCRMSSSCSFGEQAPSTERERRRAPKASWSSSTVGL